MTTAPRPRSVTLACLLMGLSCLIVMISIIGELQNWGSLELQESISDALQSGPLANVSVTVSEAMEILRWIFLGILVLSIAGIVFAVFTARGDRTSRNFLTGVWAIIGWTLAGGGLSFLGIMLAVVLIYLLWLPESRRWFAGETDPSTSTQAVSAEPVTRDPFASQPVSTATTTAPPAVSIAVDQRPRSVVVATTITLIASGIVAAGSAFSLLVLALVSGSFSSLVADDERLSNAVADTGMSPDTLLVVSLVTLAVCLVLALAGLAAAMLTLARKRAGLIALAVISSITLLVSILGFPVGIPWTIAAIVVLVQLRDQATREWFRTT